MEISRGMYVIPQSGILDNKLLGKILSKQVYRELPHTPGIFRQETRQVCFTLVLEGFGIKYVSEENTKHLLVVLKEFYKCKRIGPEVYTVESPSTGNTKNNKWISQCQITSPSSSSHMD